MPYDPKKHHRRSIRLKGYDYSGPGWYYLTICAFERQFLFGEIVRNQMHPSLIGVIVQECWNEIPQHFPSAALDVSVVMPNHFHGILIIEGARKVRTGTPRRAQGACHGMPVQPVDGMAVQSPRPAAFGQPVSGSLATIVGQFKQAMTRRVESSVASEAAESPQSPGSPESYGHATACPPGMPWHARTSDATVPQGRPPPVVQSVLRRRSYMAKDEMNAVHGEKMIEVKIRFWTNDLSHERGKIIPKHARTSGVVRMERNPSHGIEPKHPRVFHSLLDIGAVIEKVLIEHGVVLHPSRKMKKYFSGCEQPNE